MATQQRIQRAKSIYYMIMNEGYTSCSEICEEFNVSASAIARDIHEMFDSAVSEKLFKKMHENYKKKMKEV